MRLVKALLFCGRYKVRTSIAVGMGDVSGTCDMRMVSKGSSEYEDGGVRVMAHDHQACALVYFVPNPVSRLIVSHRVHVQYSQS
ncbi:hypothetical protein MRB53_040346 [Persea americana]|nr:hypothetical protein MRB53_040346 [Persea americana]